MHMIHRCGLALIVLLAPLGCTLDREGRGPSRTQDHFYTIDPQEAEIALDEHGYSLDGVPVAGYVYPEPTQISGISTVPLYRLYHNGLGDHFYTTSASERDNAVANHGYQDDGVPIAAHVLPFQFDGSLPFYRLWQSQGGDHFYTTDVAEKNDAIALHGYVDEGIEGFIYPANEPGTVPLYRMYRQ